MTRHTNPSRLIGCVPVTTCWHDSNIFGRGQAGKSIVRKHYYGCALIYSCFLCLLKKRKKRTVSVRKFIHKYPYNNSSLPAKEELYSTELHQIRPCHFLFSTPTSYCSTIFLIITAWRHLFNVSGRPARLPIWQQVPHSHWCGVKKTSGKFDLIIVRSWQYPLGLKLPIIGTTVSKPLQNVMTSLMSLFNIPSQK